MNRAILPTVIEQLKSIFSVDLANFLARESGLVRRSTGKLNPMAFLIVMVVEMTTTGTLSLSRMSELLQVYGSLKMTPQALSQRLDQSETVRFLKLSLALVLQAHFKHVTVQARERGVLGRFRNVYLEDSSSCDIHEKSASAFKASGGSASKAGFKMHLTWNATKESVHSINITPSSVADVSQCRHITKNLSRGDLVLRDLGYFDIECFREIHELGAYFLSRLRTGTRAYLPDGTPIKDLPLYLDQAMGDSSSLEIPILIGVTSRLAVRLIAFRVPKRVYDERMRKLKRATQRKGQTVSKAAKAHNKFSLFVTNIPVDLLSTDEAFILYKFRWQIELVFKNFKSNLQVDIIRGQSPRRVECFIISKLIAIIAISMLHSFVALMSQSRYQRELSFYKLTDWVLTHRFLMVLFRPEHLDYALMKMQTLDILALTKQKRSRKTTRQLLQEEAGYFDLSQKGSNSIEQPLLA